MKFKKLFIANFVSSVTIVALLAVMVTPQLANAAAFTASKDTATRLEISALSDHTVVFTLPTGIDFDSTTQTDILRVDFPSTFATSGTWLASEFTLNDGTARTSVTPSQGAGIIDCTVAAGVNNFCVSIDTTAFIFSIKPSATWTASATAATVTFTIAGSTGNGTLTNPSSVAATNIDFQMCDETASCTTSFTNSHSSQIAYAIADSDRVSVTATVNSTISFDLDTATTDTESAAAYSVALGTLAIGSVNRSNGSINSIWTDLATNASGGAIITVLSTNSSLASTSVPADTVPSATATMAAGTANYGLCIATAGTLTAVSPYNGATCVDGAANTVGLVDATSRNILNSGGAPVAAGRAQIRVNAAISGVTKAHTDYTDTLTFIATGTF